MEITHSDMREIFSRARAAFWNASLAQSGQTPEDSAPSAETVLMVRRYTNNFIFRLVDDLAWIRNVPADPVSVFASYETGDDAMAGIFAAAARVEQDFREDGASDEYIDLCHAVTFDLADYLLEKNP